MAKLVTFSVINMYIRYTVETKKKRFNNNKNVILVPLFSDYNF